MILWCGRCGGELCRNLKGTYERHMSFFVRRFLIRTQICEMDSFYEFLTGDVLLISLLKVTYEGVGLPNLVEDEFNMLNVGCISIISAP